MAGNIIHRPFTRVPGRIKDGHKGTGLGNVRSDGGPCHAHAEVIDEYNVQHHVDGACDKQEIEGRLAAGSNYQKLGPAPVEHFAPAHRIHFDTIISADRMHPEYEAATREEWVHPA